MIDYRSRSTGHAGLQLDAHDHFPGPIADGPPADGAEVAQQWAVGPRFSPTEETFGPTAPELLPLSSGGFVLVYRDTARAYSPEGPLRGQVYSASGSPVGAEFTIESVYNGNHQQLQLAELSDGRFVVLFSDRRAADGTDQLRAQIFDAAGTPVGVQITVPTTIAGGQAAGSIIGLDSGGFVVFWGENWIGVMTEPKIRGQMFDAAGVKVGGEFEAGVAMHNPNSSAVARASDGSFLLAYTDSYGYVEAQYFNAQGQPVGSPASMKRPEDGGIGLDVSVAALAGGGFVVTWTAADSSSGGDVYGQMLDAGGARIGSEFLIAPVENLQKQTSVTALKDGGFAVVWNDQTQPEPNFDGATRVQFYDAAGTKVGDAIDLHPGAGRMHNHTAAATLSWGGLVVAHGDYQSPDGRRLGAQTDVYLQILSPPGIDARADAATASEDSAVTGNVFLDNGDGVDVAAAGASPVVGEVNGLAGAVGQQVELPSGALLTLNADGTFRYDPNGAFNSLAQFGTGASNSTGTDSFTYRLLGGDTATVTVTVRGVFSGPHHVEGSSGADTLTGTAGVDIFAGGEGDDTYEIGVGDEVHEGAGAGVDHVRTAVGSRLDFSQMYALPGNVENLTGTSSEGQGVFANGLDNVVRMGAGGDLVVLQDGGNDIVSGGAGDDYLYWGGAFDNSDRADGGAGYDTLGLIGNYTLAFDGDDLVSIEKLAVYSSGDPAAPNSYALTMQDANLAAGQQMMVVAQSLRGQEAIAFDGSREADGSFNVRGGWGADTITGGAKADTIWGNLGADTLRGGAGKDLFEYNSASESTFASADVIMDFARGDKIALGGIDADGSSANGNSKFAWLGAAAFSGQAGQLRVSAHSQYQGTWVVEGDTDGDKVADFVLYFVAPRDFVPEKSDFYL